MQDTSEGHSHHSPWERFTPGAGVNQAAEEAPCLDATVTQMVAHKVECLMSLQRFTVYSVLPDPAERWVAAGLGR